MAHIQGSASVDVSAPLATVWELVQDVERAPRWQGGLDRLVVLERDSRGRPALAETENDVKLRRVKARVRFAYEGPSRLSWTQERGDMRSLHGAWELRELGAKRTRVTYSLDADPGRVLGLLLRGPVELATRAVFINGRPGELQRELERGGRRRA